MIIIRFKNNGNINFRKTYKKITNSLDIRNMICNKCEKNGFVRHGSYERNLTFCGLRLGIKVRIIRIKCKHCGITHAILISYLIPFSLNEFNYIVKVYNEIACDDSYYKYLSSHEHLLDYKNFCIEKSRGFPCIFQDSTT